MSEPSRRFELQTLKADFFKAIWNVFNWDDVTSRLSAARAR